MRGRRRIWTPGKETHMAEVICYVESCKNHNSFSNTCRLKDVTISDDIMTAAGFIPKCDDYDEKEE